MRNSACVCHFNLFIGQIPALSAETFTCICLCHCSVPSSSFFILLSSVHSCKNLLRSCFPKRVLKRHVTDVLSILYVIFPPACDLALYNLTIIAEGIVFWFPCVVRGVVLFSALTEELSRCGKRFYVDRPGFLLLDSLLTGTTERSVSLSFPVLCTPFRMKCDYLLTTDSEMADT